MASWDVGGDRKPEKKISENVNNEIRRTGIETNATVNTETRHDEVTKADKNYSTGARSSVCESFQQRIAKTKYKNRVGLLPKSPRTLLGRGPEGIPQDSADGENPTGVA